MLLMWRARHSPVVGGVGGRGRHRTNRRAPTVGVFIGVYVGWIVVSLAAAFSLQHLYGLDARRGVLVVSGGIMALASSGHPWWLYETLRRVRWFGSIRSDGTLRPIMLVIGVFAMWVGLYVPAIGS
jgi:hypothetical protein